MIIECLQSKCATCCAMAPARRACPKAARPTPDSTPWHIASTNAETSLQLSCLWQFHAQLASPDLAWRELLSETLSPHFSESPPRQRQERCCTLSVSRKFPARGRFPETSRRVASPPESTYAVAHVVPARSHRLRAAATLHAPGAAAPGP